MPFFKIALLCSLGRLSMGFLMLRYCNPPPTKWGSRTPYQESCESRKNDLNFLNRLYSCFQISVICIKNIAINITVSISVFELDYQRYRFFFLVNSLGVTHWLEFGNLFFFFQKMWKQKNSVFFFPGIVYQPLTQFFWAAQLIIKRKIMVDLFFFFRPFFCFFFPRKV